MSSKNQAVFLNFIQFFKDVGARQAFSKSTMLCLQKLCVLIYNVSFWMHLISSNFLLCGFWLYKQFSNFKSSLNDELMIQASDFIILILLKCFLMSLFPPAFFLIWKKMTFSWIQINLHDFHSIIDIELPRAPKGP